MGFPSVIAAFISLLAQEMLFPSVSIYVIFTTYCNPKRLIRRKIICLVNSLKLSGTGTDTNAWGFVCGCVCLHVLTL